MPRATHPHGHVLRVLMSPTRFRILQLLLLRPRTVTELTKRLRLRQPTVSYHLKKLRECAFVRASRRGAKRVYEANRSSVKPIIAIITRHAQRYCP